MQRMNGESQGYKMYIGLGFFIHTLIPLEDLLDFLAYALTVFKYPREAEIVSSHDECLAS